MAGRIFLNATKGKLILLSMDIAEQVRSVIAEINNADLSEEETQMVMDSMLSLGKWEEVRNGLLNILYENDQSLWNETIRYIYFFQNRGYTYEPAKTIAILNNCLSLSEELDGNLVWTITINIKSISYLSDYEPYHDPEVLNEMGKIEEIRNRK
jgi:hypothetical protein